MSNEIMRPVVSLSLVSADAEVGNTPQKVLMIGQRSSIGTATSGVLYANWPNDGSETLAFGRNSQLANGVKMFKSIAPIVQLDVIPIADNIAGVNAAYTFTFAGTTTEAGTITIYLGSMKRYKVTVPVASGVAHTSISSDVNVAINTYVAQNNCPFSSTQASGVVTVLYACKGTCGNSIPVGFRLDGSVSGTIAGLTCTLAQSVVGSTDPTNYASSAIFDVIGSNRYQAIIWPNMTNFDVCHDFLDARFNASNRILDGVGFCRMTDSYANVLADAQSRNSKSAVLFVDKKISLSSSYIGPASGESDFDTLAAFVAIRAMRLTDGAAISQYLTTKASGDQFGGSALASLPYFNTTIPTLSIPVVGQGFTDTEIDFLESAGASIIGQNVTHTNVLVGTVSMTYKTDPASNPDPSWKYLNYVDTMSNVREYFFNNYKKRFAQSRLTDGTVVRGRDMVNRALFEAYTDQLYGDLSGPDFTLVQAGEAALKFFKKNRVVTTDLETGTITVNMLVPIVTQVRTIIGTIKIAFSTEG